MAWTDSNERAYHRGMEKLTRERGFSNLATSHAFAVKDCPAGCACAGCYSTRKEYAEAKERRAKRLRLEPFPAVLN